MQLDVTFENVQGDEEGKQNSLDETNVFQVAALQGMHRCIYAYHWR